jgi:hypothetical protein
MNRGRAATPALLASLSEALGEQIGEDALISLPDSDALLEVSRTGYQRAVNSGPFSYRRFFSRPESTLVFKLTDCLADRMLDERGFLLTKPGADCGAVTLDISVMLRHSGSLIRFDGDSLSAISADQSQGLLIDHNPDDYEQTYEIAVWGDRWSSRAQTCDGIEKR